MINLFDIVDSRLSDIEKEMYRIFNESDIMYNDDETIYIYDGYEWLFISNDTINISSKMRDHFLEFSGYTKLKHFKHIINKFYPKSLNDYKIIIHYEH